IRRSVSGGFSARVYGNGSTIVPVPYEPQLLGPQPQAPPQSPENEHVTVPLAGLSDECLLTGSDAHASSNASLGRSACGSTGSQLHRSHASHCRQSTATSGVYTAPDCYDPSVING